MNFFSASFIRTMFSAHKDDCDWLACGAMTDGRAGGGGGGGREYAAKAIKIVTRIITRNLCLHLQPPSLNGL